MSNIKYIKVYQNEVKIFNLVRYFFAKKFGIFT